MSCSLQAHFEYPSYARKALHRVNRYRYFQVFLLVAEFILSIALIISFTNVNTAVKNEFGKNSQKCIFAFNGSSEKRTRCAECYSEKWTFLCATVEFLSTFSSITAFILAHLILTFHAKPTMFVLKNRCSL